MGAEELNPIPVPAIEDVHETIEESEFVHFVEGYNKGLKEAAMQSIQLMCTLQGIHSVDELVTQPYPQEGPRIFLENAEIYRYLPNFEVYVLKAVESNYYAAVVFLGWFSKRHFFQMEFFEEIIDTAIKTEKSFALREENLPADYEQYERFLHEEIETMRQSKALLEELQITQNLSKSIKLPNQYKAAASINMQKLISVLETLIEHYEWIIKEMRKIFAQRG